METCLAQNSATTTLNQTPLHIQKLLDTKPCPVKFPTFAGLANEDFVIFRDRFTTAAQARGISRIDQVDKLRDMLTGKALAYLPKEGIGDIDVAWEYLSQVYGNSHTILNFHLAKLVGMPGMTDEIMETNPQDAADWFLDMEILVDSILRVGVRSQELQWLTFSRETMFHCIISKLPYRLLDRTYELDTQGEEKLRQVLQLIRRARANAQARATDIANNMILSSNTVTTLSSSSRAPDTGHMMGTSSLPARSTSHPTSLPPSLHQASSDTCLSPTPLPCMPDTDLSSLCSTPGTPMSVSERSHSSPTSLPIVSSGSDSRPNLTMDTELPSLLSTPYTPQNKDTVSPTSSKVLMLPEDSPISPDMPTLSSTYRPTTTFSNPSVVDISGVYDVKKTDTTTLSNPSVVDNPEVSGVKDASSKPTTLSHSSLPQHVTDVSVVDNPEVSVVKEAGSKPVPDLARHSPRFNLLYKQPYKPPWLRVLPDTFIVPITTSRVMLSTVLLFRVLLSTVLLSSLYQSPSYGIYMPSLISNTLNTPLMNCLTTSPLEMPSWTLQTSSVTYDMLASSTILFSTMCSLLYLNEDPCSVDWLCVPSHRISMDTPTTAKIQSPSTLMLCFIVSQSVYYSEESTSMPPKPPKPPWLTADKSPCTFLMICPDTRELSTATVLLSTVLLYRVVVSRVMMSTYCHILLSSLYQSTTLNTPMMNCLTTSPVVMPSWTIQTSSVTYDMLASSAILFSLICTLGSLSPSIVQSPVKPPTTPGITMSTPTENFFLANSGSLGNVGTPSVAMVLLRSSSVSISSLHVTPGPKEEESQSIQFESEFLHLLLFSVRQGPAAGMTDLSTPPFTSMLCPTYVAATLLIQWDPGLMNNFAARTVFRL